MNFLLTLIISSVMAQAEDLEHLRIASWESRVPNIVICNGADIEPELVERAVDAWRARGERAGSVSEKSCASRPNRGEIAFYVTNDLKYSSSSGEAVRNVFKNPDGSWSNDINHARIYIRPQHVDNYFLIEHELGHAFGFLDTGDRTSVMSRVVDSH